jgi:hypothetical protein
MAQKLEKMLKSAKTAVSGAVLGGALLASAYSPQEARGQSSNTNHNDVSIYFKVKKDGMETRVLTPGETYGLEVWARAPGTKTISAIDMAVQVPSQATIIDQRVNNPDYGTNDFFQGVSMWDGLNMAYAINSETNMFAMRYVDTKLNPGSTKTNGLVGTFSFTVAPNITNLESAVFDSRVAISAVEGIFPDANRLYAKDTRLPLVIVPAGKENDCKLFTNSKDSQNEDGGYHYNGDFYREKEPFASPFGYVPEAGYALQNSDNLKDWNNALTSNARGFVEFTDPNSPTKPTTFYRFTKP